MKKTAAVFLLILSSFFLIALPVYRAGRTDVCLLEFPEEKTVQEMREWAEASGLGEFQDNGMNFLYSRHDPLDGKNLYREYSVGFLYGQYLMADGLIGHPDCIVTLSKPLYYYNSPGEGEPAFVLEAGKKYIVYSNYASYDSFLRAPDGAGSYQFGLGSWPTYEKGWRYAIPFIPIEELENLKNGTYQPPGFYYVGLGDLKRVLYEETLTEREGLMETPATADDRLESYLYAIDYSLYYTGNYRSPDFLEEPYNLSPVKHTFDIWDSVFIVFGLISLGVSVFLFRNVKRERQKDTKVILEAEPVKRKAEKTEAKAAKKSAPCILLVLSLFLFALPVYRSGRSDSRVLEFPEEKTVQEMKEWTESLGMKEFQDNGMNFLYSRQAPLDGEALCKEYRVGFSHGQRLYIDNGAAAYPDCIVTLSKPLYYYNSPGDGTPALVLEAGKKYIVYTRYASYNASLQAPGNSYQYGLGSWPTYEKGWRYALPFIPIEDFESVKNRNYEPPGFYYVGLGDLKRVLYEEELTECSLAGDGMKETPVTADDRLESYLYAIDFTLYYTGNYRSPDFLEEPYNLSPVKHTFDIWDGVSIALGVASLGAACFLFLKGKKKRPS